MESPRGAAPRAPKNVPADRMETIAEDWLEVMLRCPVASLYPVEKRSCQCGMARMPLMVPVSYLVRSKVSCAQN
jgi:hypothetical protein